MTWDPHTWKRSLRVLLGFATIWPILYLPLFFVLIFSGVFFGAMFGESNESKHSQRIDLIQLERKIQSEEIRELRITSGEIRAFDRNGGEFHVAVDHESTREEIVRQAQQTGADGKARVSRIEENTSQPQLNPLLPVGFILLFGAHMFTILLAFVCMPIYIILPLKNERLDQNMRIVWVILACTVGMFSNAVYWYLNIWRRRPTIPPSSPEFT